MWIDRALARQVAEFWENAGCGDTFPRDLRKAVSLALPAWVEPIDRLTIRDVQGWLQSHNMPALAPQRSRPLRGCLVAYLGYGTILIDGDDSEDEQRFTLAHEIAHFLLDYQNPRLDALANFGSRALEVLDGLRPATPAERLHGVLRGSTFGLHVVLMERGDNGEFGSSYILKAENRADQLAFALLAPAEDAAAQVERLGLRDNYGELRKQAAGLLARRYGLPKAQAQAYGGWLLRQMGIQPGFRERFGVQS